MSIIKCVVMGTCGSGKTTVGKALAKHFNATFIDGDDLHPRHNVEKMRAGHPLNDEDRKPWLERVSDVFFSLANRSCSGVVVCSALKKKYRDIIRQGNEGLVFIHLYADKQVILDRMSKRQGHYMKTEMVDSQFEALEFPDPTVEKDVCNINVEPSIEIVIDEAIKALEEKIRE
ncbi:MAG TPA: gluconate kinase [Succinivibrionaceae bacterium]|nr:gluconate kinase [Succinivibrionaceae bacterium]